jgi:uncharacterized membrane protein
MGTNLRNYRWLPLTLAAVGFLFSVYLEVLHVRAWLDPSASSFCSVSQTVDCTAVALSNWSSLGNVPLPIWGLAGFWVLFVASLRRSSWLLPLSLFAAFGSLALLLIELKFIGAVCLFCEGVHIVSWLLAAVAWLGRKDAIERKYDTALLAYGIAPAFGLLVATLIAVPAYWKVPTWRGNPPFPTGITADGHHWIGSTNPTLVVEEWVDYGCPHCKVATQRTLRTLAKSGNSVQIVRRHHPRMNCSAENPTTCIPLRVAICAAKQGRFWQMDRWLFSHTVRGDVNLEDAARDVQLNYNLLKACFEAKDTFQSAEVEYRAARKAHVVDTPTYRIDGKKVKEEDVALRIQSSK